MERKATTAKQIRAMRVGMTLRVAGPLQGLTSEPILLVCVAIVPNVRLRVEYMDVCLGYAEAVATKGDEIVWLTLSPKK